MKIFNLNSNSSIEALAPKIEAIPTTVNNTLGPKIDAVPTTASDTLGPKIDAVSENLINKATAAKQDLATAEIAKLVAVLAPTGSTGTLATVSYSSAAITATITNGNTLSNSFVISLIDKIHIFAPITLTATATLQVSIDGGQSWRNPLNNALLLSAGQALNAADLAPCSGLFRADVQWRILLSTAATANRVFSILGTK